VKNKAKSADEVIASIDEPEKPAAGELIPENEIGFNLASDEQKEAAAPAPTAEKTDEMFGSEVRTTPPTAMDRRNAAAREMVAPVSAHVETHTPETLEGEKLNRSWTAFAADAGSLNVPRAEMPQIKSEHRGALVNFLKARGITATTALVDPSKLKPTQAEYSEAKVQRAREFEGSERPILISADNHVVDGHHQWIAALDSKEPDPGHQARGTDRSRACGHEAISVRRTSAWRQDGRKARDADRQHHRETRVTENFQARHGACPETL
jgi:hypothetical protein